MSAICPICGLTCPAIGFCEHHPGAFIDEWAASNRIVCDLIHRKITPERLEPADRGLDND